MLIGLRKTAEFLSMKGMMLLKARKMQIQKM